MRHAKGAETEKQMLLLRQIENNGWSISEAYNSRSMGCLNKKGFLRRGIITPLGREALAKWESSK